MRGGGLCDEWPHVSCPDHAVERAFDHELKPGMVLCVEALVCEDGGDFSIKLEDQVLITEDSHENLTTYLFDTARTAPECVNERLTLSSRQSSGRSRSSHVSIT